ncbi:hypothetical protein GCK32_012736 [Trichostrongylus colubriformis]|uniref:Uncharacterized protein n=1 Tax=Trichostrongylus colubriformis TaxID=6319 RepID=A0AAN8FBE6_TRICO
MTYLYTFSYTSFFYRLGTDTSSGSSRSKKTTSSASNVQKHLPKYIQSLFRGRMSTDPCKRHMRSQIITYGGRVHFINIQQSPFSEGSNESNASSSAAVLEFTRQLQNYPLTKKEMERQNMCCIDDKQDSPRSKARYGEYVHLPELEIQGASPPRSPGLPGTVFDDTQLLIDCRRPSSPQAIPGLPLIEIRRPSAVSQFEFGYFVNSPELTDREMSDCTPLLLMGGPAQADSRKSSDETSLGEWSSRASSVISQRSSRSSAGMRLSTFSGGTSIASDNSGPFLFSFVLRKRASTIGNPIAHSVHLFFQERSRDICSKGMLLYSQADHELPPTSKHQKLVIINILAKLQQLSSLSLTATFINYLFQLQGESLTAENHEQINEEYLELQDQVTSGSLPCPREEAAYLASIQLCIDEQWPSNKRTQTIRRHLLKGQFGRIRDLAQKIMVTPWEVDQNLYCTPPRFPFQSQNSTSSKVIQKWIRIARYLISALYQSSAISLSALLGAKQSQISAKTSSRALFAF